MKPKIAKQLTKREVTSAMNYYAVSFGKPTTEVKPKAIRKPTQGLTEHQIQRSVIAWWGKHHDKFDLPINALFAIPNGGVRDMMTAVKLKAEGVRRGVPDLFLATSRNRAHGLWIEMKKEGGRISDEQHTMMDYLTQQGYLCEVCWSLDDATNAIKKYLSCES